MSKIKNRLNIFLSCVLCFTLSGTLLLTGCVSGEGEGRDGGLSLSEVADGVQYKCGGKRSVNAEGKVTEIDGIELKFPVDWNYAKSQQSNYDGVNWEGDDAYRGIGMFNACENGDDSEAFANSYSVNIRWDDTSYGHAEGVWPTHEKYKATSVSMPDMVVGGSSASCTTAQAGGSTVDWKTVGPAGYRDALIKSKIMVVNPKNGKACICGPGFIPSGINADCNWGGAPLGLYGGITKAVSAAITDSGDYDEIQPHVGDDNVALELYWVDENLPYGPCDYDGANVKSGSNKCKKRSNVDNSTIANLAVSVSYDANNTNFSGHEMIERNTGSDGHSVCPTTELAIKIRELATGDKMTADCGFFVASVVRMTVDGDYKPNGTGLQYEYCVGSPDWEVVGTGTYQELYNSGELQPGDVYITEPGETGHTSIFVGYDAMKEQYDYLTDETFAMVGANRDKHGPNIQHANKSDSRKYTAFRFIGEPHPVENASKLAEIGL